ncbi:MAG: glycerophosphodiester phosphodiesterase family protein [Acutalibacteraceae bacterium]
MINFEKTLYENTRQKPLVCAHRGAYGGNVPCNTMASFKAAVFQGADIIELDVIKSRGGELFVFHSGKEWAHLRTVFPLRLRSSKAIKRLHYVNYDNVKTHYSIERLEDVLLFLKGKCYINIDKFWKNIPAITSLIRKCGVENQVIVKAPPKEKYLKLIEQYAPDLMYMPILKRIDRITDKLMLRNITLAGAEVLFELEDDPVAKKEYAESMHENGLVVFRNAIVYDEKAVISAGLCDDNSIIGEEDANWGKLIDNGSDIIQTDFCAELRRYIDERYSRKPLAENEFDNTEE